MGDIQSRKLEVAARIIQDLKTKLRKYIKEKADELTDQEIESLTYMIDTIFPNEFEIMSENMAAIRILMEVALTYQLGHGPCS